MAESAESRDLPKGLIAAAVFLVALTLLLLLFYRGGGDPPAALADFPNTDITEFEERVEAALEPVALRPARELRVRGQRVVWHDPAGRRFFEASSVVFSVEVASALGGAVLIRDGLLSQPVLDLVQTAGGDWNYEGALQPLLAGGDNGRRAAGGGRFALRNIAVRGGRVSLRMPGASYRATSVNIQLTSAELSGPGVADPEFRVARAEGLLDLPAGEERVERQAVLEDARLRLVDGALAFEVEEGAFGEATFADAIGVWDPDLGGLGLDMTVSVTRLELADLPWLPGEVPEDARGSARVRIAPLAGDRSAITVTELSVRSRDSFATGSVRLVLAEAGAQLESIDLRVDPLALDLLEAFTGPLPYTGQVRGSITGTGGDIRFDLQARLATSPMAEPFTTAVTGRLAFTEAGVQVRTVTAQLDQIPLAVLEAFAPGLPFRGVVGGSVTVEGAPGEAPLRLDLRLEAGGGIVTVAGVVNLQGAVPTYDLSGRLIGVRLQELLEPAAPPALLNARFELAGRGTELATADARLRVEGGFTGWRAEPGDTLSVRAEVASGLLRAETFLMELGPVELAASGEWRFAGGTGGAIQYTLDIESLAPLAPYLPTRGGDPVFAQGSVRAQGTLSGTLSNPVLAGSVAADDFRYGAWAAEWLRGEYDFRMAEGLPFIEAEFEGAEIRTPSGDFERARLTVDFTRPEFDVAFVADRMDGGIIQVEAGGRIEETGAREILLRTAEIDLEDQRWRLPEQARIAWLRGEAVRVENLLFEEVDGGGVLRLEGIVAPADQADFAIELRDVPVGPIADLVGGGVPVEGRLSADGRVRGPGGSPVLDLEISLEEGAIRDVPLRSLQGRVAYSDAELTIDAQGLLGEGARVQVEALLPARMSLGLPPSLELLDGRPVEGRIVTNEFPLETLDPGIRSVRDLEGLLHADVRISGTPDQPRLDGEVRLAGGEVTVPMLDKRYTDVSGTAVLAGRELRIQSLTARSGGTATLRGTVTFERLTDPALDLRAELLEFQPQGVGGSEAEATGTVRLGGSLSAPVLTGEILLDNGDVDVTPFMGGPGFGERLVGVSESLEVAALDEFETDQPTPTVRIDEFQLRAGTDLWFRTQEARVQLRGTLVLNTIGSDIAVRGDLRGERGTFSLRVGPVTRRFQIIDASLRFFGSPDPNPALDVTAARNIRTEAGGSLEVRARVTGTVENPRLQLATADGPSIAESELLSFLVFGRPTFALEQVSGLGETFLNEYAFGGVLETLSEDVPLDYFQIEIRSGGSVFEPENLWLVMGEEVINDIFVSVETPLTGSEMFVAAADWRIDRQWTLELSWGPVTYVGSGAIPPDFLDIQRQWLLVVRRRWTY